ncbi:hypothetical protein PHJA_002874500 [Phtheirospermum japonicum]|uniref:Uncharacterized protein n=1 Tax=Phtheirospermum japonicum TaxID=374723 RepID=A0A830DHR7_9LAMI|nr:hypothetical protein PHJA_002874500 [Phtheirospermum japonicum]
MSKMVGGHQSNVYIFKKGGWPPDEDVLLCELHVDQVKEASIDGLKFTDLNSVRLVEYQKATLEGNDEQTS